MKFVALAVVSVALIGAAPAQQPRSIQKHFPNGGSVETAPIPWLENAPLMKNIEWFCNQAKAAPTAEAQARVVQGIRTIRRGYQGDLSQRAYKCMREVHAI